MSEVIQINFGKEQREAANRLAHLLGLGEKRDADILSDPLKYFNAASAEISRLRSALKHAHEATTRIEMHRGADATFALPETLTVPADEFRRLQKCADIVAAALEPEEAK